MKPTFPINETRTGRAPSARIALPKTDQNFRADSLADFSGRCHGSPAPSFRRISNDYFNNEARGHFLSEAAMFALMVVTAAVPVIQGARGAVHLLRGFGLL